jgi:hypothetical protein
MLLLLLALSDPSMSLTADVIERNHVVDCSGRETLDQWIWWRWRNHDDYRVLAWRQARETPEPERIDGRWVQRWKEKGRAWEASALVLRETWSLSDREIDDRVSLPAERRSAFRRGAEW